MYCTNCNSEVTSPHQCPQYTSSGTSGRQVIVALVPEVARRDNEGKLDHWRQFHSAGYRAYVKE